MRLTFSAGPSPLACWAIVCTTSTRSPGRMKPPAVLLAETRTAMARMPEGRMAERKPLSGRASFTSRIGSPATNWLRTIEPLQLSTASGRVCFWM